MGRDAFGTGTFDSVGNRYSPNRVHVPATPPKVSSRHPSFISYFCFILAAMIAALHLRFSNAKNRHLASTGERVTIVLIGLGPGLLVLGLWFVLAIS